MQLLQNERRSREQVPNVFRELEAHALLRLQIPWTFTNPCGSSGAHAHAVFDLLDTL